MDGRYRAWIEDYVRTGRPLVGHCRQVCGAMQSAFPELELRGGWVRTRLGLDVHYWLRTPEGLVVDPTEAQFGQLAPEDYEDAGSVDPMVLLQPFLVYDPGVSRAP